MKSKCGTSRMARTVIMLCAAIPLAAGPVFADSLLIGDMNADGVVDFFDIDRFVEILMGGEISHAGPIDYWPLDGLARDYGDFENSGTLAGDPVFSDDVPPAVGIGQSLEFDGAGDYVYLGTSLLNGGRFDKFTFEAWFKTPEVVDPLHATIFGNETTDGEFDVMVMPDGALRCLVYVEDQEDCALVGPSVTDDLWRHVALRKGASEVTLFLDGVWQGSCAAVGPLEIIGESYATIGAKYTDAPAHFFFGLIDEVQIYDYPRTDAQIAADAADCGDGWLYYGHSGHSYRLTSPNLTWAEAVSEAAEAGGHLVTINDEEEDTWLCQTFRVDGEHTQVWIGFTDEGDEGYWTWLTEDGGYWEEGDPGSTSYVNWGGAEPDGGSAENHAQLILFAADPCAWKDVPSTSTQAGIIERP